MAIRLLDIIVRHQHQIQLQFCLVDRCGIRRCCNNAFPGLKCRFRLFFRHPRNSLQKLYFPGLHLCSCIPGEISDAFRVIASRETVT